MAGCVSDVVACRRLWRPRSATAWRSGRRLRAELERHGKPLAALDLLIASHALSEGCVLVTADQAFALVDELTLEVW